MDVTALIAEVTSALGVDNAAPLTMGGQKLVLNCTLSAAPAIVKVVMLPPSINRDVILERAHREVELLSAVESPHVVKVLTDAIEIGDPPEAVCWVEEFLDGTDVLKILGPVWPEEEVWRLLSDVAEALDACHGLEVVHRDLSPSNVRRLTDGRYVVMDPGLARHLAKAALTGSFQPGTIGWRSPEHVPGGEPIPASDVFSLGLLAFFALTGEFAIDPSGDELDYFRRLSTGQAPSVRTRAGGVSLELASVVDRCLHRQPARRYLDGRELLEEISAARGLESWRA